MAVPGASYFAAMAPTVTTTTALSVAFQDMLVSGTMPSAQNCMVMIDNPSATGQTINAGTLKFTDPAITDTGGTVSYTLGTVSVAAGHAATFPIALSNGYLPQPTLSLTFAANPGAATVTARLLMIPSGSGGGGGGSGVTSFNTRTGAVTLTSGDVTGALGFTPGAGTVTSVNVSGGTTGFTFTGGPITSSGTITLTGTLGVANGGTGAATFTTHGILLGEGTSAVGVTAAMTNGQLLVGQTGADPLPKTISGDVTVSAAGAVTINSLAVTYAKIQSESAHTLLGNPTGSGASPSEITLGAGLSFSGSALTATGVGTVTSVDVSGGTTGLTSTGGPITSSGTITLAGTLVVANGGTGVTTLTTHGIVLGQGTSAVHVTAAMTDGQLLVGQTGADPAPTTLTGDVTLASSGVTSLKTTGTAGTYGQVTTDAQGRVISGTGTDVPHGGTGQTSLTAHGILIGEGTSAINTTAVMTNGQLLVGQTAADPLPKTLSGDATLSAAGAITVANAAITYAKMQNEGASSLLGNPTGSPASPSEITLGSGLAFSGTTLIATGSGGTVTQVNTGTGLTGGPITGTGTIALSTPVTVANGGTNSSTAVTNGNLMLVASGQIVDASQAPTGSAYSVNSNRIINVTDPTGAQDAATKHYADSLINTVTPAKLDVQWATTAALPASTYNNGTAGVGATLTANAAGVLTVDGGTPALNDRIMVKDQASNVQNGLYSVTTLGTISVPFVLTRTTDYNTPAVGLNGAAVYVTGGTANANTLWFSTTDATITFGTTPITFREFVGIPGSPANSVQFNNAGLFGGTANFTYTAATGVVVTADADAHTCLVVKAHSGTQSANLQSWQKSDGTVQAYVDPTGASFTAAAGDGTNVNQGLYAGNAALGQSARSMLHTAGFDGGLTLSDDDVDPTGNGGNVVLWGVNNYSLIEFVASGGTVASPTFLSGDNFTVGGLAAYNFDGTTANVLGKMTYKLTPGDNTTAYVQWASGLNVQLMRLTASGQLEVGANVPDASAAFQVDSTARGFAPPRGTTTQKNAIASPLESLIFYDTTLHAPYYWNGSAWTAFGGGGGTTSSNTRAIAQTAHGFSVGNVVKYGGTAYALAKADTAANAADAGIVSAVADANNFTLLMSGYLNGLSGLTPGVMHYLSATTAGALTATEPTSGNISKQLLVADSTSSGYFQTSSGLPNPLDAAHGGVGSSTVPSAGQVPLGNAGGTAYAPVTMSGDATITSAGAITVANGAITPAKTTDLRARLTADVTNATATMANLSDLSVTLVAGKKYVGRIVLKCNNSVAAEGIQLDFNGGTATTTNFWAAANQAVGGTNVAGTLISTSLAGVINFTTITGETLIVAAISLVCNAGGTFIPRVAENSHSSGTLTAELGSFLILENSPN